MKYVGNGTSKVFQPPADPCVDTTDNYRGNGLFC